ncbi:chloramphenicol O-acetyltransferase type A [Prevotella aff. ruminicola Tc2-24]|jgi:chloramphenicol O-acetyltransferase type A|uniref:Chloramphenicol O-acetyltransferase type A n=1 Tax=Prevotella aff. ruminicola Tc2-24 TaxID=81582 RepID=A0A1I0QBK5_9BACT|nr:CatA-like O-acetyltransferase, family 2 [Prevotella aff. ruminicola Tc2-24]SEW24426.1 chloramphenicol O-acetyltransferase type A [Prevotella aff. ruminicola Tc2-24]
MKQEVNPQETSRAKAFELWMKSPMPMVTLTKTFDVTRLYKVSKQRGIKFNVLLCWCIGKTASRIKEFYLLPEKTQTDEQEAGLLGRLYKFDSLAINVIVDNKEGDINSCDIPYTDDLEQFNTDYLSMTRLASETCTSSFRDDMMIVGTSTLVATELDCIVNQYSNVFNNPFLAWGRYRHRLLKTTLPISFQFHHVQMDGGHAARFLEDLQKTIKTI